MWGGRQPECGVRLGDWRWRRWLSAGEDYRGGTGIALGGISDGLSVFEEVVWIVGECGADDIDRDGYAEFGFGGSVGKVGHGWGGCGPGGGGDGMSTWSVFGDGTQLPWISTSCLLAMGG